MLQERSEATRLGAAIASDVDGDAKWLLMFRADEAAHGALRDGALEALRAATSGAGASGVSVDELCAHWQRSNGAQLHNTCSVIGGIASQEIIKVVTQQYVPIDNTLLWNGIKSRVSTWAL